jgi:S-DNA-T family DNA segregation ATPase FtsK/SpoIIIE
MGLLTSSTRSHGADVSLSPRVRLRVPVKLVIVAWFLRTVGRVLIFMIKHPADVFLVTMAGVAAYAVKRALEHYGPPLTISTLALLGGALLATAYQFPGAFDRFFETPIRSRLRHVFVYRRQWQPAMVLSGLAVMGRSQDILPKLVTVRSTGVVDLVRVRMLPGQILEDWSKAAPGLAQTFGARECRVRSVPGDYRQLDLWMMVGDPLAAPVDLPEPIVGLAGLYAVPVGMTEDQKPLRLRVAHSHLLVAGQTGSGKGSVLWAILCGLAPAIRFGTVKVWAIDPKGGMELTAGEALFDRFETDPEGIVETLEEAATRMQGRAQQLRGKTRKLEPTVDDPLIVIMIDELAAVVAYQANPDLRRRATAALNLLLSQGRAVGVSVVAAVQDPRKETVAMRDLFPTRIALRAAEAEQADMVLGRGARDRGALTDKISTALPGVGYAILDDAPEPVRVRFAHVTDQHIAQIVEESALADAGLPGAGPAFPSPRPDLGAEVLHDLPRRIVAVPDH